MDTDFSFLQSHWNNVFNSHDHNIITGQVPTSEFYMR